MSRPFTDGPDGAIHYGLASPPQQNLGVFGFFSSKQPEGWVFLPPAPWPLDVPGRSGLYLVAVRRRQAAVFC
jgi:hypothetical protein